MACKGIPANDCQLFKHLQAVAQVADPGACVVCPADRHFLNPEAALECDEEDLRIEAPALNGLKLEDGLRGRPSKSLEAALRIGKGEPHNHAAYGVKAAAEELPVEGLAVGLAAGGEPARADCNVGTGCNSRKKALCFVDGGGQVGVGEHDDVAQGMKNAVADGISFAAIAGILKHANFGSVTGNVLYEVGGVIGRTIVDDDDFGFPSIGSDACNDGLEGSGDARTLIKRGNHNTVFGILRHDSPLLFDTRNDLEEDKGMIAQKGGGYRTLPSGISSHLIDFEGGDLDFWTQGADNPDYAMWGGLNKMTKADLVEKVTRLGDLTRRDGEVIVETVFDSVISALQSGDKIEIRGFGSFRIRQRNPRIGRNPKTGERVEVPAKRVPYFKPSKELRDLVNPGEVARATS